MTIRHLAVLGSLAAVATALLVAPALADDLTEHLEEAEEATYSGTRLIGTTWDGVERTGVVEVEHHGGVAMVSAGPNHLMVGDGKVNAIGTPGSAIAYEQGSTEAVESRYALSSAGSASHLGRSAYVMEIMEEGRLRMRMVVDVETGAPLQTEVFDGEGHLFRYSTMVEFSPETPAMDDYEDDGDYRMMVPLDEARVPDRPGRYVLVDVYTAPADGQQAFYTDGLFTFSLFAMDGTADVNDVAADSWPWVSGGFEYVRKVTPAEVWVLWSASGSTYALVGDLPPDHLDEVLANLPRPERRNWFSRVWNNLFG